ncbi:MAG: hypothetical protein K2N47_02575 [Clostridia bacterium]|nr:hypothetical protein [Clostridia bacterium]
MTAVFIVVLCVCVALGALVGVFKKLTKTSIAGVAIFLTLLLEKAISSGVDRQSGNYGLTMIIATIVILVVIYILLFILKKCVTKAYNARIEMSHYKNHDKIEENELLILNALDNNDKKKYRYLKRERKNIKDKAGAWGVVNRILGGVFGATNLLVACGVVIVSFIMFADLSQIAALKFAYASVLESGSWINVGKGFALDVILISALALSISAGLKGGISSVITFVVILGMLFGFGAAAFAIASSEMCAGAVTALSDGLLAGLKGMLGDSVNMIATAILALIIFLLSLILVILVGIFLPKLVDKFRENKVFNLIDGVLGAIVLCGVIFGLLTTVGGIAATLSDLPFMAKFNEYAASSGFADALYTCNPLASLFDGLPLRGWFNPSQAEPSEGALSAVV